MKVFWCLVQTQTHSEERETFLKMKTQKLLLNNGSLLMKDSPKFQSVFIIQGSITREKIYFKPFLPYLNFILFDPLAD